MFETIPDDWWDRQDRSEKFFWRVVFTTEAVVWSVLIAWAVLGEKG